MEGERLLGPATDGSTDRKVKLPGGEFRMGIDDVGFPEDGEGPIRTADRNPFYGYAVTNAVFLQFVRDTGYMTEAEEFGWSFVFGISSRVRTKTRPRRRRGHADGSRSRPPTGSGR